MSKRLPKILMLHGYTQNGSIFSNRVAAIRKACQGICEMIFVDGPIVLDIPTTNGSDLNEYDSTATNNPTDPSLVPRAWWKAKHVVGQTSPILEGFDDSMKFIRKVLDEQGPFDACFGFSQGAALAGIISKLLEQPKLHVAFHTHTSGSNSCTATSPGVLQPPFKAVILVSGLKVDVPQIWSPNHDNSCNNHDNKIHTRSLHVIGTADTIISEENSRSLAELYLNPRIELHTGSHFVPSKKNWRLFFLNYFTSLSNNYRHHNGEEEEEEGKIWDDESLVPSPHHHQIDTQQEGNLNNTELNDKHQITSSSSILINSHAKI